MSGFFQKHEVLIGRIAGIVLLLICALEFRGSFRGPYPFIRKPSLVLAPLHAPDFDPGSIAEIRLRLEKELAFDGTHALYPKSLIENFYLERDNATDVFDGSYLGKDEALELGAALGMERIAIVSVLKYAGHLNLYLTIHDVSTDQVVTRISLESPDIDTLINWTDLSGESINLTELMELKVPGLSISARLYLGWLGILAIAGILMIPGIRPPRILLECLIGSGILLSLFSWIYALNGDMDYVQRFVATSGLLNIGDTSRERAATLVRYLAPMAVLTLIWVSDLFRRLRTGGIRPDLSGILEVSAPLWIMLSAVLYSFSLPNFLVLKGLPFLAWVATAPLYLALRRVGFSRALLLILFFTGLQSLLVNWWQGTFSYISLPFTVGLTLVQYVPFILLLALTIVKFRRFGLWAVPFLWVAWDLVRSLGFLGYPWGILGAGLYGSPALIQSAALGGIWMVSFLPHFSSAVLAVTADYFIDNRPSTKFWRPWIPLTATILGIAAVAASGALTIRIRDNRMEHMEPEDLREVRILLVQQNTDPRKHDYQLSFDELSRLSEEAVASDGPFDLIAWPESGFVPDIRFWLDEKRSRWKRGKLVRSLLDWQAGVNLPLVTGNQDHFYEPAPPSDDPEAPEEIKRIQNSAVYLPPDRKDDFDRSYYYKMRLVPFTENFPFREEFPWVAELLHNFSTTQWTPGTKHIVLEAPGFRFATPICFEDVFPDHLRQFVLSGAEVFVNMSNDYWANTPLEGYQHGAHAVFRAVENRRPLVRSTCSGWTISVDTQGRIADGWPPFYEPGWTVAEHRLPREPEYTFYTRFGDWFPVLCGIIWFGILLAEGVLIIRTGKRLNGN